MSDNVLKLIPSSPVYVPDEEAINKAVTLIREIFSVAESINVEISDSPRFIDQGSNWERVICPTCKTDIDTSWWQNAMDSAYKNGFRNLVVQVPCCGTEISLNDLKYEWPAGIAKFSIEIRNPGMDISDSRLKQLEIVSGSSFRKIWAHY